MWDLETIIRINNEACSSQKKDSSAQSEQEETGGNERVWDPERGIFKEVTFVRSVYEGEVD